MNNDLFVKELGKLRSGSTFLSLKGYRNAHGEVSNYSLVFHMSYEKALEKSIDIVNKFEPTSELQLEAKNNVIASLTKSLSKPAIEEVNDAYVHFQNEDGSYVKGVKLHQESNTIHIYGLQVHKRVLIPGEYPTRNKRPLTVEQDFIKSLTPVSKFRQFKITRNQVDSISVDGMKFLPAEADTIYF